MEVRRDPVTGENTTGHEWDGLEELDKNVPWPFKLGLVIAIAIAAVMWVMLPSWPHISSDKWPYVTDYTKGTIGYSDRGRVARNLALLADTQAKFDKRFTDRDLKDLLADPEARKSYFAAAATLFRENCAMCHGRKITGRPRFPNLADNQWLWSGDVDGIYETIKYGINSEHDDSRSGSMPAFGKDEMLDLDQIHDVVEYVMKISGQKHLPDAAKRGAGLFKEHCVACHQKGGVGNANNGAPNLTDDEWIYEGHKKTVYQSVFYGRAGVMPHWVDRLRDAEMRQLALYVKWVGADIAAQKAVELKNKPESKVTEKLDGKDEDE